MAFDMRQRQGWRINSSPVLWFAFSSATRHFLAVHMTFGSPAAQRTTRFALKRMWKPVGAGVMVDSDTRHLISTLFSTPEGRIAADRIDRRVDTLPGLHGLGLMDKAQHRYG